MISRTRILAAASAALLATAALGAPGAGAETVGAVSHFPTHCSVGNLVAGPDGNVWFPCNRRAKGGKPAQATIGQASPDGTVREISAGLPPSSAAGDLVLGPDGNLWFSLDVQHGKPPHTTGSESVGRITPSGQVSLFSAGLEPGSVPGELIAGSDGNVWFQDLAAPRVGRVTPDGQITEFPVNLPKALAIGGLAAGAEGSVWFTQEFDLPHGDQEPGGLVGKVAADGSVSSYGAPPAALGAPIAGPDGNIWFAESSGRTSIDRVTPDGQISSFGADQTIGAPSHLAAGPDGNVWYTAQQSIGRVTPSGAITTFSGCLDYRQRFSEATTIVPGPAGDLWFLSVTSRQTPSIYEPPTVGRITTEGQITQFRDGISGEPRTIVAGPDGNVWFSAGGEELERITPPSAPVNTFILAGAEASRGGATRIGVEVPGPGKVELHPIDARLPDGRVKKLGGVGKVMTPVCGRPQVRLKLRGTALEAIRAGDRLKLRVRTTFTPVGGSPHTEVGTVIVKPKAR